IRALQKNDRVSPQVLQRNVAVAKIVVHTRRAQRRLEGKKPRICQDIPLQAKIARLRKELRRHAVQVRVAEVQRGIGRLQAREVVIEQNQRAGVAAEPCKVVAAQKPKKFAIERRVLRSELGMASDRTSLPPVAL